MIDDLDITLSKIRLTTNITDSVFLDSYEKLFRREPLSESQYVGLLSDAIIFLRSSDDNLNKLGYRIVLQYTELTSDFVPLHRIAMAKDLMPIAEAIENHAFAPDREQSFNDLFFAANKENYRVSVGSGHTYRTRGQMELRAFASATVNSVVVAPTSYGKSEMMVEKVREYLERKTCIIVPTKALIAQTKTMLIRDPAIRESRIRLITHPDAYTESDRFLAVLTQERLSRLLQRNPGLAFDLLLVDEAHNVFPADGRSAQLSQVLMTAQHRNRSVVTNFYTPFVTDVSNLEHVNSERFLRGMPLKEIVKVERIHYTKLKTGKLFLYDQFLNRSVELPSPLESSEMASIAALAGNKNILYVNRPRDAEKIALDMSKISEPQDSEPLTIALDAIAELIHPDYSLIRCLRHGVAFHHGKVPEILRLYIEDLFSQRQSDSPKYLATTSTLLEGVNTPADTMFILSPAKGGSYLERSAFKNLIGRVARFSEVFRQDAPQLSLLQPNIYLFDGDYPRVGFNPLSFLQKVADVRKPTIDKVANPLLANSTNIAERDFLLEYLENVESGSSGLATARVATSSVGRLCFQNGVLDFDIFANEATIAANLAAFTSSTTMIQSVPELMPAVCAIFFNGVDLSEAEDLQRVRDNSEAQAFYGMFLEWRSEGTPYKRMVAQFLHYWETLTDELVFLGSTWGEHTYGEFGHNKLWVRMSEKNTQQRVNLAVAKVKEEQDFVDFRLMRYIEMLNDLEILNADLYNKLKYGTKDPYLILLIKNGLSFELAKLVSKSYRSHVEVDLQQMTLHVQTSLASALADGGENDILVYEAASHA